MPATATVPSWEDTTPAALRDAVNVTAPSAQATCALKNGPPRIETGADANTMNLMRKKEDLVEEKMCVTSGSVGTGQKFGQDFEDSGRSLMRGR